MLVPLDVLDNQLKPVVVVLNIACYVISTLSGLFWYWPHSLRKCNCAQGINTQTTCTDDELSLIMYCGLLSFRLFTVFEALFSILTEIFRSYSTQPVTYFGLSFFEETFELTLIMDNLN